MGAFLLRHFFRGAGGHNMPAPVAALGPQVNEIIRGLDDLQVVFDDDHRVAGFHQAVQYLEKLVDVSQVQARGRFVQDIEGAAGGPFTQFPGKLQALGLAAGQRGGGLPQLHVAQPHVRQGLQAGFERRHRPEDFQGLVMVRSSTSAMVRPL